MTMCRDIKLRNKNLVSKLCASCSFVSNFTLPDHFRSQNQISPNHQLDDWLLSCTSQS